jgi:hypothetical protein
MTAGAVTVVTGTEATALAGGNGAWGGGEAKER